MNIIPEPWETIDFQGSGTLKAFEKSRFNLFLQETNHVIWDRKIAGESLNIKPYRHIFPYLRGFIQTYNDICYIKLGNLKLSRDAVVWRDNRLLSKLKNLWNLQKRGVL